MLVTCCLSLGYKNDTVEAGELEARLTTCEGETQQQKADGRNFILPPHTILEVKNNTFWQMQLSFFFFLIAHVGISIMMYGKRRGMKKTIISHALLGEPTELLLIL